MQRLGVFLLLAGVILAIGYSIYYFFAYAVQSMPWALKVAISGGTVGLLLILVSLIRERIKVSKEESERFKGVDK